jgi:hypothetical protein
MVPRASNVDVTSTHPDPNEVVRAFAASPEFRAETAEELVNEHNPFRRSVRPDDLAWLDFSVPLVPGKALMLSALLGHRMLRNIYDADTLYVPEQLNAAASDGGHLYSAGNPISVVYSTLVHDRRKSRSSPTLLITFQPQWVFEGLEADTPRGATVGQLRPMTGEPRSLQHWDVGQRSASSLPTASVVELFME